jgi:hypothetical protein
MLDANYYESVLLGDKNDGKSAPSKNYKATSDPNVYLGRNGVKITRDEFNNANKNGYTWSSFEDYADYVGGWAHNPKDLPQIQPYYRTYPNGTITGGQMAKLILSNDRSINSILKRNIAPAGEIPMFGAEDSDVLKGVLKKWNSGSSDIWYENLGKKQ